SRYAAADTTCPASATDEIAPMSYVDVQGGGDGSFPHGRRHNWKASFLRRLDAPVVEVLVDFARRLPSPYTEIALQRMHGAAARVAPTASAFGHRHDQSDCFGLAQWSAADDEKNIRWAREFHAALSPYVESAVYVNDLGVDEADRVPSAYGENYERLAAI